MIILNQSKMKRNIVNVILEISTKPTFGEQIDIELPMDYWKKLRIYLHHSEYWFALETKCGHVEIKTYKHFQNGKAKIAAFLSKFN